MYCMSPHSLHYVHKTFNTTYACFHTALDITGKYEGDFIAPKPAVKDIQCPLMLCKWTVIDDKPDGVVARP